MQNVKKINPSRLVAATVTAALALVGVANAGPIPPYSTGFNSAFGPTDNPPVNYKVNTNLVGQNNWVDAAPGTGNLTVVTSTGVSGVTSANGDQVVQSIAQGQYAKGANNTVYSDVYSNDTIFSRSNILLPTSAGGFGGVVDISYDLNRIGGANRATGFGVEVFGDNQNSIIASLFLGNATDNTPILLTDNPVTGAADVNAGYGRNDGAFNTYRIELNYLNNSYTVFVDGNTVGATYSDPALANSGIGGIAFANTNDGTDTAYYDNLRVVPEPAVISMIGIGAMMLVSKRPKRA